MCCGRSGRRAMCSQYGLFTLGCKSKPIVVLSKFKRRFFALTTTSTTTPTTTHQKSNGSNPVPFSSTSTRISGEN